MINLKALSNELTGTLFEYLVGLYVLRNSSDNACKKSELLFLNSIDLFLLKRLIGYEQIMRFHDNLFLKFLENAAERLSLELVSFMQNDTDKSVSLDISNVLLSGKLQKSRRDYPKGLACSEEDIVVLTNQKTFYFSLKIYKNNLINTKSGGVFSFINQYFLRPDNNKILTTKISAFQDNLTQETSKYFLEMVKSFFEIKTTKESNLVYDKNQAPEVNLKNYLQRNNLSDLPGQIAYEYKEKIHQFYYKVVNNIKQFFIFLQDYDKNYFAKCLMPLCGFSGESVLSILFYESKPSIDCYQVDRTIIINKELMYKSIKSKLQITRDIESKSYFEIKMDDYVLSIRVKPMDKFTTAGVKINCSLKILK